MGGDNTLLDQVEVIAELANAHEGEQSKAIKMINSISDSADAVKIQLFSADDLAVPSHENYDLYENLSLSKEDLTAISDAAHKENLQLFADILGTEGLNRVTSTSVDGFKIHSSDVTNQQLIMKISQHEKPTLISAGGATPVEIKTAISSFREVSDAPVGLVYGFQDYPTKLGEAHLNRLQNLINEFGNDFTVGYTSHIDGGTEAAVHLPAWSVAAGADFVEVHTTLDRSLEGTDYYSALEPEDFVKMAENIDEVNDALGEDTISMSKSESKYRDAHKKCVIAARSLSEGETIAQKDVVLKRPQNNSQYHISDLNKAIGRKASNDIESGEAVLTSDITHTVVATLACRAESTRLYGKPLQLVGEQSIISHQISQLKNIEQIDDVVLAIADTSSKQAFISTANNHGIPYIVGNEKNVLERIINSGKSVEADFVVRTTTENPFIYTEQIKDQIKHATIKNADLVVARDLPLGSFTEVISMEALEQSNQFGNEKHRSELVTSFITENPHSFNIYGIEPPKELKRPDVRLTVDYPQDLILVRSIWDGVSNREDPYSLRTILEYYDSENLKSINDSKPDGTDKNVKKLSWHIYGDPSDEMNIIK